jgi:Mg2+/Co2+ transporter CorC
MRTKIDFVTMESTVPEINELLNETNHVAYPLVENKDNMILIGAVQRGNLEKICREYKAELQHLQQVIKEGGDVEFHKTSLEKKVCYKIKF